MKKFIGNKAFYRTVLMLAVPMALQNGVTNFVSLLDNIMVGQVGTEQMTGVAIVSQLIMVVYVTIFGTVSGPGIFCAQFFGSGDHESLRGAFRFKLLMGLFVGVAGTLVLKLFSTELIGLYLTEDGVGDAALTLHYAEQYLSVMLWSLIPFAIGQVYCSTMREIGQTLVPMAASLIAVVINLVGNWIFIFGNLGAPALGVVGAALATVASRYVETAILIIWPHVHAKRVRFTDGVYRRFRIPAALAKSIALKSAPLLLNELLWSVGLAALNRCYSLRGLTVMASVEISSTLNNLLDVICFSLGNTLGIMVGQQLGAGNPEGAVDTDRKLIAFDMAASVLMGGVMAALAGVFPSFYNVSAAVRQTATGLLLVTAATMPISIFTHVAYFTLRSGGKTLVTFLFDSCFVWAINIPLVYILAVKTDIPIVALFLISQLTNIVKCVIGGVLVHKRVWVNNLSLKG